ncbi:hypothetical protein BaRGS_00009918 [Batillaria attramentaria]|uniref:Homeobox domain-containing protein n=1 Tax=Batillaria attramentaria TaxID=370345 RepID=A0ABD0LHX6_9CAEN
MYSSQTLPLPAHYPPGFADLGTALAQRGLCANGRPYVTDPSTGQPVCLCQLGGAGLPLPAAHRTSPGTHNSPTASPVGMQLPPISVAQTLTSSALGKEPSSPRTIPLGGPYTAAALYHPYLYAGLEAGGIRKAAVRETTGPLKAWLHEHRKNPYPTKAEKIMLAIITQMTLTQVSTWFANARRRLKKENRGGSWDGAHDNSQVSDADDESDDKIHSDDETHAEGRDGDSERSQGRFDDFSDVSADDDDVENHHAFRRHSEPKGDNAAVASHSPRLPTQASVPPKPEGTSGHASPARDGDANRANNAAPKPRIWSISAIIGLDDSKEDTATRETDNNGTCSSSERQTDREQDDKQETRS